MALTPLWKIRLHPHTPRAINATVMTGGPKGPPDHIFSGINRRRQLSSDLSSRSTIVPFGHARPNKLRDYMLL